MNYLVASTFVALASVFANAGETPSVLLDAYQLNAARRLRVDAEIALHAAIVEAKQELLEEGHAAPLEVDTAQLHLEELRCLSDAVEHIQQLIDQLVMACEQDGSNSSTGSRQDPAHHVSVIAKLSAQIAQTQADARGRRTALGAEAAYLTELLERLRRADDGSAGARQEIALARLRLVVVKRHMSMEESQRHFAATLNRLHLSEHQLASPIEVTDGTIQNVQQLAAILQSAWKLHRTTAQREALRGRIELRMKYQRRLAELEQDSSDRPGAAIGQEMAVAEETRQLRSLDHIVRKLQNDVDSHFSDHASPASQNTHLAHVGRDSHHGQTSLEVAVARHRVIALTELTVDDSWFNSELQRAQLDLAVAEARAKLDRQHTFVTTTSLVASETNVMLLNFRATHKAELKLADHQIALLNWRLSNLKPLRQLGYATWKEVALVERDLAIAKAERQSTDEAYEIAMLQIERNRLLDQKDTSNQTAMSHP